MTLPLMSALYDIYLISLQTRDSQESLIIHGQSKGLNRPSTLQCVPHLLQRQHT